MSIDAMGNSWWLYTSIGALLACGGLVLLAMQVWLLLRDSQGREQAIAALRSTLSDLSRAATENAKVCLEIEHRLKRLGMRQDQIEVREPGSRPYRHAIMLVKRGASTEDLMASCGLSQGEAELIVTIHKMKV
jgi:hypothetical protein